MLKKEKIKHYFTLNEKTNSLFMNYIKENYINKQKLLESLVVKLLKEKNKSYD